MLTENDIHAFLKNAGIKPTDTVLIHSSMRSLGEVDGGCDGLIDSFISYLTEGLLIIPTHTWASVGKANPIYDVTKTPPCIGALPTVAAKRKDGARSLHPTHSVAAFGKRASEFILGEEKASSPCFDGGAWQRLYGEDAKILLIGVGLDKNTYIHAIDEMLNLPGRLADPIPLTVIDENGREHSLAFSPHGVTGSRFFENYRKPLEAHGALINYELNGAKIGLFYAKRATEIIKAIWKRAEYNLCGERRDVPEKYYSDFVFPEGDKLFFKGGADYIEKKIAKAIESGARCAEITGSWEIEKATRIPSDFTLIMNNCHLRLADGSYTNIFINECCGKQKARYKAGGDKNISIIGRGEAILDGGKYNGLSEKNQLQDGLPPIWKNNLLIFSNVDGFRIEGISCRNQRHWALNFIYARNGYIGNVDFIANDTAVDGLGREYHGLKQDKYSEVLVKNADGIDLRQGCSNVLIENVSGFTEDDTVALTGLCGALEDEFSVYDLPPDIHTVEIKNIHSSAFCSIVRLLNQGGIKLHDIKIEGIYDTVTGSPYMDKSGYAVRIGDTHLYGDRHATPDETYNLSLKQVSGGGIAVLYLAGNMKNLTYEAIEAFGGAKLILDKREKQ